MELENFDGCFFPSSVHLLFLKESFKNCGQYNPL